MTLRVRSRNQTDTTGKYTSVISGTPQTPVNSTFWTLQQNCQDIADTPGVDHLFELTTYQAAKSEVGIMPISGTRPSGIFAGSNYDNYLSDLYHGARSHASLPAASQISSNDFAALRARTNPSRPVVTPLTLIHDVVELPGMLKEAGGLIRKFKNKQALTKRDIANHNLGVQFGWLPLVDDMKKVLELQIHIHRRITELNKLYYNQRGLKRRIKLGTWTAETITSNQPMVWNATVGTLYCDIRRFSTATKWGTIRWIPIVPPPLRPDTEQIWQQAWRSVSGMTLEGLAQGAWDVLPWTWLSDWFVNVGDYMLTYSNTVPAVSSNPNVMLQTDTIIRFDRRSGDTWVTGGTGVASLTTKKRSTGSGVPFAAIPFIGLRRLSILSSLFVQRFR